MAPRPNAAASEGTLGHGRARLMFHADGAEQTGGLCDEIALFVRVLCSAKKSQGVVAVDLISTPLMFSLQSSLGRAWP